MRNRLPPNYLSQERTLTRSEVAEIVDLVADLAGSRDVIPAFNLLQALVLFTREDLNPFVHRVRELHASGRISAAQAFYLISWTTDFGLLTRMDDLPEVEEIDRRMDEIARSLGRERDEMTPSTSPPEYGALDDEFGRVRNAERVRWLQRLGEHDMAHLLECSRGEFDRRLGEGGRALFGPDEFDSARNLN